MKSFIVAAIAAFLLSGSVAEARTVKTDGTTSIEVSAKRHKHHRVKRIRIAREYSYDGGGAEMLSHPSGCPSRAFCGCGAAVRIFGEPIRNLWLARAWFKFPRTSPGSGMVAVRPGHVFVLESHVEGSNWLVSDYNSGGHQSRRHVRSIAGYAIVNPHARGFAEARL